MRPLLDNGADDAGGSVAFIHEVHHFGERIAGATVVPAPRQCPARWLKKRRPHRKPRTVSILGNEDTLPRLAMGNPRMLLCKTIPHNRGRDCAPNILSDSGCPHCSVHNVRDLDHALGSVPPALGSRPYPIRKWPKRGRKLEQTIKISFIRYVLRSSRRTDMLQSARMHKALRRLAGC